MSVRTANPLRHAVQGGASLLVLAATIPLFGACDTGLQAKLFEARDKRYKSAKEAVYAVEVARNEALDKSLPAADAKFEGETHPMMAWRKAGAERDDLTALKALAASAKPRPGMTVGAMGTPAQSAAEVGASYLRDVAEFWSGTTTLSRYLTSIDNFDVAVARAKGEADEKIKTAKGWEYVEAPFGDEARFDLWFVHAASYLQLSNLSDRSMAWDAMHPAYGVAFGISRRMGEGSSDYVSRLCFLHDSLKDKCKGVPAEFRAALVDRAFLEVLLNQAKSYRAKTERAKVFDKVAERFAEAIQGALATEVSFKEDLVLPSTVAAIAGRSGVRFVFSEAAGVTATTDAEAKLAETWNGTIPATLAESISKLLIDTKDKPGNRVDYQRIVLEMAGTTPVSTLLKVIKLFPPMLGEVGGVKDVFLVGRRRVDDSMRLAALRLRIPRADDSPNIGFKFKEDAATTTCQLVGRIGDPPVGKKNEYDLEIRPDRIRATAITINEETAERVAGDTVMLGTPADLSQLEAWLEANPGRMRAFVSTRNGTYDDLSLLLSKLLFKCSDEQLTTDDASKPPATRTCGVSEPRAVSFVLGICD